MGAPFGEVPWRQQGGFVSSVKVDGYPPYPRADVMGLSSAPREGDGTPELTGWGGTPMTARALTGLCLGDDVLNGFFFFFFI